MTMNLPTIFTAGDTLSFTDTLADYPASAGWFLNYRIINSAGKVDIQSTASGDDHVFSVAATVTDDWNAGDYQWQAFVTKAAERYTVSTGSITIKPDLAAEAAGYDARSTAIKAIADLKSALATWTATSGHVAEYEIAGRRMKFKSVQEISDLLAFWKREAADDESAQRIASGQSGARRVLVRF